MALLCLNSTDHMPTDAHPILRRDADRVSFADLSQELRDMVYAHLWRATPYLMPSLGVGLHNTFKICYDNDHVPDLEQDAHLGLPQWLLASKGVCYQGIKKLLDNSYWNYCLFVRGEVDDMISRLVNPSLATRVTYQVEMWVDCNETGQALEACFYPMPTEHQLSTSASQLSSSAKHLTLDFQKIGNFTTGEYSPDITWMVDLSAFDRIKLDLESVTLYGVLVISKDPRLIVPGLSAAFTTEMSRLGAVLLGQDTRVHVEEDIRKSTLVPGWDYELVLKIKVVKV